MDDPGFDGVRATDPDRQVRSDRADGQVRSDGANRWTDGTYLPDLWLDDGSWVPPEVDPSRAHPARRYDYWLGGKDHFAVDRASGDAVAAVFPTIRTSAVQNRLFLGRAVEYLARRAGITQFLDVGTGLPAAGSTHEIVQRVDGAARVVYVDNDPVVLAHARALLTSPHDGTIGYLDADLRRPGSILRHPGLTATLDLSRPVALVLVAVLHYVADRDGPYRQVRELVAALAPGSHLVISHATSDFLPERARPGVEAAAGSTRAGFRARSRTEVARFFEGHRLVSPGLVSVADWRPPDDSGSRPSPADVSCYGGVAEIRTVR